jgi:hypothetical protein
MRRFTLSAAQNYLGSLYFALLCFSGFKPFVQLVGLFSIKLNLRRSSTHPRI